MGDAEEPPAPPEGEPEPSSSPAPSTPIKQEEPFYLPIYVLTAIFGAIGILGPLFVRKGPNSGITKCCIMLTAFSMWIFWTTTYIVQMNPLLAPRMPNHSLAWIGHRWGKDPKKLSLAEEMKERI